MNLAEFHANIWANLVAAAVFAGAVWLYVSRHGGHCPVCGQVAP